MAEYPNAARAGLSPNRSPRQGKVRLFIVHHYAGTQDAESAWRRFNSANDRSVSPNYQVNADGSVFEVVPPDSYRAWTTGVIDHQAVTCETQNTTGAPSWGISAASHEAIAHLIAWAAQRYGFPIQRGRVDAGNIVAIPGVVGHRETPAGRETGTACPGPSMDTDWLVTRAQQIAAGIPAIDTALLRRQKEGTMFIKGTSNSDVYKTFTDPNGNERLRACGTAERAYALAGGLVITGDDATLTMLGIELRYRVPYTPEVSADIVFTDEQLKTIAGHIKPGMTPEQVKAAVREGMLTVTGTLGFNAK